MPKRKFCIAKLWEAGYTVTFGYTVTRLQTIKHTLAPYILSHPLVYNDLYARIHRRSPLQRQRHRQLQGRQSHNQLHHRCPGPLPAGQHHPAERQVHRLQLRRQYILRGLYSRIGLYVTPFFSHQPSCVSVILSIPTRYVLNCLLICTYIRFFILSPRQIRSTHSS